MLSPGSFSSTPSLLYSESDPTEEESEVFSSGGEVTHSVSGPKTCSLGKGSTRISESPLDVVNQRGVNVENGQTGCSSISPAYTGQTSASERVPTEGDLRFASKCSELHGYVRPLLELLHGLKTGRFVKGLSTFQQSTAMDRLRKILGILQKPELGEKYMGTLLQLESMLKVWFPQAIPQHRNETPLQNPIAGVPPRWNQDQLHIPVKKRRLSWSDSDSQSSLSFKRFHEEERGQSSDTSSWLSSSETTSSDLEDDNAMCANQKEMTSELKPAKDGSLDSFKTKTDSFNVTPATKTTGKPPPLVIPPAVNDPSNMGMQDCSVSSTTPTSDTPADLEISEKDAALATHGCSKSVKGEGPKKQVNSKSYHTKMSST